MVYWESRKEFLLFTITMRLVINRSICPPTRPHELSTARFVVGVSIRQSCDVTQYNQFADSILVFAGLRPKC